MNSRKKGARGEREFRDVLRAHGFCKAHRGQQYSGLRGNADVVCPELPGFHFEVKRTQKLSIYDAVAQAKRDAAGESDVTAKVPVVAHKKNHSEWLAILPLGQFLEILRRSDLVEWQSKQQTDTGDTQTNHINPSDLERLYRQIYGAGLLNKRKSKQGEQSTNG